jgi:hypothetical protein
LQQREKEYFDTLAGLFARRVIKLQQDIADFYRSSDGEIKTLLNFCSAGFDNDITNNMPLFLQKSSLNEEERAINDTYKFWIIRNSFSAAMLKVSKAGQLSLEFFKSKSVGSRKVLICQKYEQKLKEAFALTLQDAVNFWFDYFQKHHPYRQQELWMKWRIDQLKFQSLRKKLPELEGVF